MVITNLEEKQNRKIWVPIRGGNRGGWSLFDWQQVREMPYRDREMYLGNSAKIGVLDKGGKWRKKDWYLHKDELASGEQLTHAHLAAIKKDQDRMNAALGITEEEEEADKLTPAEMQLLLKKIRGNKEDLGTTETGNIGLGFDKAKVQIRAKPSDKACSNPHRLEGTVGYDQKSGVVLKNQKIKENQRERSRSRSQKRKKKHKKEKEGRRSRSKSGERRRERRRSPSQERREKKHKERKHRYRQDSE